MKSDELDRIERDLGVRLPADYRLAMLADPRLTAERWLVTDVHQLLELNSPQASAWPPHLLLFGHRSARQPLFLDLSAAPATVVVVEPETGRVQVIAPDFATFFTTQRHAASTR